MTETEIRTAARNVYGGDNIEIDEDAKVSAATDGGSWVAAWVYLSNETLDTFEGAWNGALCEIDPDNCWIDDATGEHVSARDGTRSPAPHAVAEG